MKTTTFINNLFLLIMIIKAQPQKKFCVTKLCENASQKIRGYMNESVDPCENFYQFACGGFIENKTIPDEYGSVSAYNILEDEIYEQGKKLLEKPIDNSKDFEAHKKAKIHYKACMDDDKQNELGDVQICKI